MCRLGKKPSDEVYDLTLGRGRNMLVASAGGGGFLIGVLLIRHGLAIGWILAPVFAASTLAALVALSPWGPRLLADGEGVTISLFLLSEHLAWSDIRGFSLIGRGRRARVGVALDRARAARVTSRRRLLWEREGHFLLPDAAGERAELLAFYLEVLRKRAGAERPEIVPEGSGRGANFPEAPE